jgi:hypothetical protein
MAEPWSADENRAIIDAYFWMLAEEAAGRPYVKAVVRRTLIAGALSRRSNGAIERKFQNISAVLEQHNIAYIEGYKPLHNFQMDLHDLVLDVVDSGELRAPRAGGARHVRLPGS